MVEPRPGTAHGQRGSALVLVPAAVLVLVILGAIAVDLSIVFLGQRELANAAVAAANDAATAAISKEAFYRGRGHRAPGAIEVDDRQARDVAAQVLSVQAPRAVTVTGVEVRSPGSQVCVAVEGRVDHLFARAIPGVPRSTTVRGRASASAVQGPPGSPVPSRSAC
jgi:Flp pilus assembly protein TadG